MNEVIINRKANVRTIFNPYRKHCNRDLLGDSYPLHYVMTENTYYDTKCWFIVNLCIVFVAYSNTYSFSNNVY